MKSVLLITDIFPPDIGGPATFIDHLAHALAERGTRVSVVCAATQATEAADARRPFPVRRVRRGQGLGYSLRLRLRLGLEMLRHGVCLVNGLEYPAYQAATVFRRPFVVKIVGDSVWEFARNSGLLTTDIDRFQTEELLDPALQRLSDRRRRLLAAAQTVITPSAYLQKLVIGWGVDPRRARVVYNGVDLAEYARFPASPRGQGPLQVAFCGRLTNWKGVDTLLLALSGLEAVEAHVYGDGPEYPLLVALHRQLGIEGRVRFHGRIAQAELPARLSAHHVLVLTSGYEGLSHALLEAGALGLPCVASDRGGNPEVIQPGVNGLLVPYGNVAELRAALVRLRDDEPLRRSLAAGAAERVRAFDFGQTVAQTAEVLRQAAMGLAMEGSAVDKNP